MLELEQGADPAGQLAAIGMSTADAEGRRAGEVAADFGAELQALEGMPVQAKRHFSEARVHAGPSAADVVEPFRSTVQVNLAAQVINTDVVDAIPGAGTDRRIGIPSHI